MSIATFLVSVVMIARRRFDRVVCRAAYSNYKEAKRLRQLKVINDWKVRHGRPDTLVHPYAAPGERKVFSEYRPLLRQLLIAGYNRAKALDKKVREFLKR